MDRLEFIDKLASIMAEYAAPSRVGELTFRNGKSVFVVETERSFDTATKWIYEGRVHDVKDVIERHVNIYENQRPSKPFCDWTKRERDRCMAVWRDECRYACLGDESDK